MKNSLYLHTNSIVNYLLLVCFIKGATIIRNNKNNKISVLIIDDSLELCDNISKHLKSTGKFQIAGMAHDVKIGMEKLIKTNPDVAVIDLVLPLGDGISILEQLKERPFIKKPAIIILSAVRDDRKTMQVMELGAQHYLLKPFSPDVLVRRIEEAYDMVQGSKRCSDNDDKHSYEKHVSSTLLHLGIPAHLKGFLYLKRAIIIIVTESSPPGLEGLTKMLYPSLAKEFKTTSASVERAIRHSIDVAWKEGMASLYYPLLGYEPPQQKKPSNGAFISSVAELSKNNFNEDCK